MYTTQGTKVIPYSIYCGFYGACIGFGIATPFILKIYSEPLFNLYLWLNIIAAFTIAFYAFGKTWETERHNKNPNTDKFFVCLIALILGFCGGLIAGIPLVASYLIAQKYPQGKIANILKSQI